MHDYIRPNAHLALRLPSGHHKVVQIRANTVIHLGKYGIFRTNDLLGRPLYHTYEILEEDDQHGSSLRLIPPAELHAQMISDDSSTPPESRDGSSPGPPVSYEGVAAPKRNNQLTIDDPSRQSLTMDDIEELKASGPGREVIAKIMASHSHLSEKTAYSLAKYSLRKRSKYMKMFTALPLDVSLLAQWYLLEKEAPKILELRSETLALILSLANVQCGHTQAREAITGRWLIVDDTAGLLVAGMAERMSILYPPEAVRTPQKVTPSEPLGSATSKDDAGRQTSTTQNQPLHSTKHKAASLHQSDRTLLNNLTLIHSATQPNLSLLSHFSFDLNNSSSTPNNHPLLDNLHTLTWLQLLSPESDVSYMEPATVPPEEFQLLKSGRKSAYLRKRRRWARCKTTVDQTRAGGFDGLVVATCMELPDILNHLVPLLRGGAPVVIYNPNAEPLAEAIDLYSSGRKTAFLNACYAHEQEPDIPSEDFPVDPRVILAPSLQSIRSKDWQTFPGRTHPIMTTKGGAEGYVFSGTRIWPAEGKVEARGNFTKKRKKVDGEAAVEENPPTPYVTSL